MSDVVRTRMFVTDIARWEEVGRAHGEVFRHIRPAATLVQVASLVRSDLLVEIEATAVAADDERTILARSIISTTETKSGRRVWRIDQDDEARPFAVLDERIASVLEAQQAFNVNSRVRVKPRANGTLEVIEVIGDAR